MARLGLLHIHNAPIPSHVWSLFQMHVNNSMHSNDDIISGHKYKRVLQPLSSNAPCQSRKDYTTQ